MSNLTTTDSLVTQYRIRRAIDRKLDTIIPGIRQLVQDTGVCSKKSGLGRAQFTNLQNVARDTESIEVIINWVEYQTGRYPRQWGGFGEPLAKALRGLRSQAGDVATTAELPAEGDHIQAIHLKLIRHYVGQLQRAIVACRDNGDNDDKKGE